MGREVPDYRRAAFREYRRVGPPPPAPRVSSWRNAVTPLTIVLPLAVLAVLFPWSALTQDEAETEAAIAPVSATFHRCVAGARTTCVVDGDTIWLHGEKIRIADIDAPEIFGPDCEAERALGMRATERLTAWLNAGAFEVHPHPEGHEEDRYGRKLRVLARGGESAVEMLAAEGVATRWGGAGRSWC
ncbi:thermonuclease family protein [Alteriqipengyuania lutimaris]|uniref:Thermonuclease family protein n=1 Tax=Alteriqipengyuania lutimaris TaxID=1538146 RepID=A0A395LJL4_9SPHN|nr:thermonuclease family protein [Alteriqipengyuania lutimaris]MBB3034091.1 endonuclease YncB(thermonuclease family) [Alteriqipengyuania lutimaris]RDS76971.1 thermonuclease family protein [Alteriqipengyuania lutimaris]